MLYKLQAKQVQALKRLDFGFTQSQRRRKQKVSFEILTILTVFYF